MDQIGELKHFPRIAVLASGSGTNLQAIIDDDIEIALVLCDNENAGAIDRAKNSSIPCEVVSKKDFKNRESFANELINVLESYEIEIVVLAGFMTILPPAFIKKFENRILNIHPSLLPAFTGTYGKGTITATLNAGVKVTGATVHIVTEEVDAGPILAQGVVEVFDGDDEETLHERIKKVEHRIYPQTIRQFVSGGSTYLKEER
ncbi:MAG: phosphoribosylglycinamide formyltransferase [Acidimicrobiia bacterium]